MKIEYMDIEWKYKIIEFCYKRPPISKAYLILVCRNAKKIFNWEEENGQSFLLNYEIMLLIKVYQNRKKSRRNVEKWRRIGKNSLQHNLNLSITVLKILKTINYFKILYSTNPTNTFTILDNTPSTLCENFFNKYFATNLFSISRRNTKHYYCASKL